MQIERPKGRYMLMNVFESDEIRIAICHNDELDGFYLERSDEYKQTGNIYKGRVENLVPSLQAAFVNIGETRNGFLHISDVIFPDGGYQGLLPKRRRKKIDKDKRELTIADVLYPGQELLVQVTREGLGQKGPALTTYISLPGRYLVLMPALHRKGVSKRIEDEDVRKRVKDVLKSIQPGKDMGVIVRTAGEKVSAAEMKQDFKYLKSLWDAIRRTVKGSSAPAPVYRESDLVLRSIRDIFTDDINACIIDDEKIYKRVREFMRALMPKAVSKIKLFDNRSPIFDYFGIEERVSSLAKRKIALPRGASIVIEQTEALVAIDVNSGKLKENSLDETVLQTNLLAAKEIVRQVMLRDLSGLIVIDFIDMENERHRRKLQEEFTKHLEADKAKKAVGGLSQFCLMEFTRQRQHRNLFRTLFRKCPYCAGRGFIENSPTLVLNFLRCVRKGMAVENVVKVEASVHPELAVALFNEKRRELTRLEDFYNCGVTVLSEPNRGFEEISVVAHLENGEKVAIT